ncbi:unnamed protein product [Pleuronectes platessa]|uniref:Uncharacterized protein n=1 Tax=Pleuronectes platessa TaxID=8262 RepID=A0A9N7URN3_PLEPL|nr:unnamed protein product [Pleuronectes platessa]
MSLLRPALGSPRLFTPPLTQLEQHLIEATTRQLTEHICLRSSSVSLSAPGLSDPAPLPACELSSSLSAFSIQQSADRAAGSRVEAVCKEVQHQAFCQTLPGPRVRATQREAHHKQKGKRCLQERDR